MGHPDLCREWEQRKTIGLLRARQEILEHRVQSLTDWVEALCNSVRLLQECLIVCRDYTKATEKDTVEGDQGEDSRL
jgi:hypothetical protein